MLQATSPLVVMMFHFFVMFIYDTTVKKEIREHKELESVLNELRWFNRVSLINPMKNILKFKFFGVTSSLNIIGSVTSIITYLVLSYYVFFIVYVLLYKV